MADIHDIIATVNPDLYYKVADDKEKGKKELKSFKELIKKEGFQSAADKAKPKPLTEHTLVYDSSSETLEPIYFFILDLMNDFKLSPQKIIDNFSSSPGSGHFSELGQRATIMQQQATKVLGDINSVLKSILNLIYDIKEFKIRLKQYDDLKSNNAEKREAAILSLKQIWMDKVDINKGNSSIKAMAFGGQVGFQTLVDAFLAVKDESLKDKTGNEIDLNERVKRILQSRIQEFNVWLKESEKELRKRYEIEKTYLKSQMNSIKLYSRWAKPYLKAAQELERKDNPKEPALVKTFNTILLELTLLGKSKLDPKSEAEDKNLPPEFKKIKTKRDYYSCVVIDFKFRGIPQKISQQSHYTFGGRAEITFSAYALNEDEIKKIEEQLDESDVEDVLKLIEGSTTESLEELKEDIDEILNEDENQEESQKKKNSDTSNPFLALIGYYNKSNKNSNLKKKKEENKEIVVRPEDYIEKRYLRELTSEKAKEITFDLFDIYKKAHGMPSYT